MRHRALLAAGASGPWTPASLGSTLKLWLDADDAATFTYSSGVVVSQWADKSGNANHGAQATTSAQPSRATSQINGKAAVRFYQDDVLTFPAFGGAFTAVEVFAVVKVDADPALNTARSGFWYFSGDTAISHIPWTDGNVYDSFGTTARKSTGNPTPSMASWNLYNVRSASGAWSSHFNGTQRYSTATNTVGMGGYTLGKSSSYFMEGHFAALIICDSVLSTGDRASLHAWVTTEYGLTIA